jgi:serine O-acetyltransferase
MKRSFLRDFFIEVVGYNLGGWFFHSDFRQLLQFFQKLCSPACWSRQIERFMCSIYVVHDNDRAAKGLPLGAIFWWPGVQYQLLHQLSQQLWQINPLLGLMLFFLSRWLFGAEIHPLAQLGYWITLDHLLGVIVGATTVIEDFVLILGKVTLGNNGSLEATDEPPNIWGQMRRHPWIRAGCRLSDGSRVFGPVIVGYGTVLGAMSWISKNVPDFAVTAGINRVIRFENPITGEKIPLSRFGILDPETELEKSIYDFTQLQEDINVPEDEKMTYIIELMEKILPLLNRHLKAAIPKGVRIDDPRLFEAASILKAEFAAQGLDYTNYYLSLRDCQHRWQQQQARAIPRALLPARP